MRRPLLIDLRNLYDRNEMATCGLEYLPLGRHVADSAFRAAAE
jgi:hypothetical protein